MKGYDSYLSEIEKQIERLETVIELKNYTQIDMTISKIEKILNALKINNIIIGTTDKKAKDFIYTVPVERAGEIFKK